MKNWQKIGKTLIKEEQKEITGGRPPGSGPCGGTGGIILNWSEDRCTGYGIVWDGTQCWACY